MRELQKAIDTMKLNIVNILEQNTPSIYIYGSYVLNDFKLGWSDIDILVLTESQITEQQAKSLVGLRQAMLAVKPDNPYYRSFEGGMLTLDAFLSKKTDRVVYWGTSGERITDSYAFDSFGMAELVESSVLLYGKDVRKELKYPSFHELYADVKRHYETIRKYAHTTGRSFYSFGWMLDIARCIYTLRTGKIIAKTNAAEWALENNLCPDQDALRYALKVRRNPLEYKDDKETFDYAETLAEPIQRFADVLENVKGMDRPVLIHVETKKGKGYAPAEKNPDLFHGVSPFHIQTGELKKKAVLPSYTSVFGKTLAQLGAQDNRIVGITAAMGKGTGINVFQEQFPDRTIDVGIAEEHAVTMAAAMALDGYKPVVAIYSTFLQRAYDQVMHDVALQNAPVVFCLDRAGLVGDDGPTHHGIFDISYLRHIPNMVCMAPKDENELRHMLYSALSYDCPVAVRYPRGEGLGVPMDEALQILPLGKAEVLQEGSRITLLALGSMVHIAQEAAARISEETGITPTVINARFAKPLDAESILRYAAQDTLLVTLEEHAVTGGFGSAVLELFNQHGMDTRNVMTIGIADSFVQHGNTARLKEMQGLDTDSIVAKIKERLG